jgi:uncharacterized membrane protein YtjA (UPF0391 family)
MRRLAERAGPPDVLTSTLTVERRPAMLKWALIFAVVAVIAGWLGFSAAAGAAALVAKILFFLFMAACALFLIAGVAIGRKLGGR